MDRKGVNYTVQRVNWVREKLKAREFVIHQLIVLEGDKNSFVSLLTTSTMKYQRYDHPSRNPEWEAFKRAYIYNGPLSINTSEEQLVPLKPWNPEVLLSCLKPCIYLAQSSLQNTTMSVIIGLNTIFNIKKARVKAAVTHPWCVVGMMMVHQRLCSVTEF